MSSVVNIAAYKYVSLDALEKRREDLKNITRELQLKGTILLSHEGINMFLAGSRESIDRILAYVRMSSESLRDLIVKESLTDYQPFQRMLVRLKREIVPVGNEGRLEIQTSEGVRQIAPDPTASPKIAPKELKQWLDEGREITLLDTRNDYETDLGTFQGAIDLRLKTFRDFPKAAASLPDETKKKPVVMFCTGGIRCEKIGPYMKGLGFENIFQLEGGILKYFEECDQAFYEGDCFVFDQRVAVRPNLEPSNSYECYACKHVLSQDETKSPHYVEGASCQYCYQDQDARRASRQRTVTSIARQQLGSQPYENRRWISIPQRSAGKPLLDALVEAFPGYPRASWLRSIEQKQLLNPRAQFAPAEISMTVSEGERFVHVLPGYTEPPVSDRIEIVYEDEALVVINKGAPLPVHPSGRFNRNTLSEILAAAYHPEKMRPCHRLDMNTTGLVVFARKYKYACKIQEQFQAGKVEKTYLATVEGRVPWDDYLCNLGISADPLPNGGRAICQEGMESQTRFRVLDRAEETTRLEVKLLTGRTHQIRLHLAALGFPILNDPLYLAGGTTREIPDEERMQQSMGLHAWKISLEHPATGKWMTFEGM